MANRIPSSVSADFLAQVAQENLGVSIDAPVVTGATELGELLSTIREMPVNPATRPMSLFSWENDDDSQD